MNQYQPETKKPGIFTPTLLGGVLLGLLSAIPFISALNVVCCIWVLLGGFVAVLLYQKDGGFVNASQGAFLGFFAGLWGTVVVTAFQTLMFTIQKDSMMTQWQSLMNNMDMPIDPKSMEMVYKMQDNIGIMILITAISWLVINSIFATLGGLLGAAILKKKNPVQPEKPQYPVEHNVSEPPTFETEDIESSESESKNEE